MAASSTKDVQNNPPPYQLNIYNIENTRAKVRVYLHLEGNTRAVIRNTRTKARMSHQLVLGGGITATGVVPPPPLQKNPMYTRKLDHALQLPL